MNRVHAVRTLIVGCLLVCSCQMFKEKDPAAGNWSGEWSYLMNNVTKPGGKLDCTVERVDKDQWKAVFTAQYGKTSKSQGQSSSYKVELLGKREGTKVVFGGDVNLGGGSGVFHWTGEVVGETFSGKYTSQFVNGAFELKKLAADAKAAPEATPTKP